MEANSGRDNLIYIMRLMDLLRRKLTEAGEGIGIELEASDSPISYLRFLSDFERNGATTEIWDEIAEALPLDELTEASNRLAAAFERAGNHEKGSYFRAASADINLRIVKSDNTQSEKESREEAIREAEKIRSERIAEYTKVSGGKMYDGIDISKISQHDLSSFLTKGSVSELNVTNINELAAEIIAENLYQKVTESTEEVKLEDIQQRMKILSEIGNGKGILSKRESSLFNSIIEQVELYKIKRDKGSYESVTDYEKAVSNQVKKLSYSCEEYDKYNHYIVDKKYNINNELTKTSKKDFRDLAEMKAEIESENDGAKAKETYKIEKEYRKEIEKTTELANKLISEQGGYLSGNQIETITELIREIEKKHSSALERIKEREKKAEQDRLDASKESMNAYLKEFGSYQQKRLAITEEYETKISEAQNDGERMMLTAQRNKALSDLDYDEWVDTGTIALAFGEISKLSDSTIGQLICDMEKYREKVITTYDPEKIEKYEEALSSLRRVKSDESFGAISSFVPDYFKERKAIGDQMDSAGSNVNIIYERRAEIYNRILSLRERISKAEKNGEDVAQLNGELREAEVELSSNAKAARKAQDALKLLQEQWDQLETPEAKFYALCNSISAVTGVIGPLASQASEMVDALGASGLASALGTLGEAMDSVGNIASGFANGGLVGGIAAAAGEVMGWVGKIFSAGDRRHDRNIERLQEQIDALNKSYEKLGQAADNAFSTDASALIEQQDTLLRQQQELIRKQMAEEEAKKKTDSDKIKQYKEQLEEINEVLAENARKAKEAIIGEDLKSAINEFASLYAEAWNDGTDAAQKSMTAVKNIISSALSELLKKDIQPASERFYNALAEAMKDGVLTDVELDNLDAIKSEIDVLAARSQEQWEMIQSRYKDLDELKEELTDISFDSVRDNFKSKLSDMTSTARDFIDDFSSMLRDALINGLMDEKYDLMLREWYDEFAEAMNDRSLTDSERDALRQQYDAIVQQGLADRDFINEIVGGGAYSQEATKGAWATLGQDQGDELNGRFTAMVELEATNNTLVAEGNIIAAQILDTIRSLSALSMTTGGDNSTLREIRDMMFLSTGHLEDISKHTKQLITIREGIDKLNDLINKRL